ncbi:hypothetical protein IKJ53_01185, partial [bacterium]|nr:hypothetical protein [bacterium]
IYANDSKSIGDVKRFYQSLAELVNKAYIRYKEILNNVDRLNLKVYLQITEILEQEQKIYNLEKYESSKTVIEAQEHLNNLVLSSYSNQLRMIQDIVKSDKLKKALKSVVSNKEKEEIKKAFSAPQLEEFNRLFELTKKGNELKLEAEIKQAQESIEEAKRRQESYEKEKKENEKRIIGNDADLEELKSNKNAIHNFFNNRQAVESTIQVLNNCCDYYYSLLFLNEFMNCLSLLDIQNEFYFIKPLDLMSYTKLQSGLDDLLAVLRHKKIKNKEFEVIAYKFMSLELFNTEKFYNSSEKVKIVVREYKNTLHDLREKLTNAFKMQNRKDIVKNVVELEANFLNTLREEKGW